MKPFELYDAVIDDEYGKGIITHIDLSLNKPLLVEFLLGDTGVIKILYTLDGRRNQDEEISLTLDVIKKSKKGKTNYQDFAYSEI